jgi:hypothetical protein
VGLDGIEPSASALSVLVTGIEVNGWVLAGTPLGQEEPLRTAWHGLVRAIDARCSPWPQSRWEGWPKARTSIWA